MSESAPVCHIPPVTTTQQPTPINVPSIPLAGPTLASLTGAVNAMRQTLLMLTGQSGANGANGQAGKPAKKDPPERWTENARVTETVRIFNPDDHEQFVDVERINKLTMKDKVTGETWTWDRDRK